MSTPASFPPSAYSGWTRPFCSTAIDSSVNFAPGVVAVTVSVPAWHGIDPEP